MSDESPPVPPPPPLVDRGLLWVGLLLPSIVVLVGNGIVAADNMGPHGENFLVVLPFGLFAILIGVVLFSAALRERYRGRSIVLLSCFYFVGQIVIGLGVWVGSCLGIAELAK